MNEATKKMVREWLELHKGDVEGLARWMRDSLRFGGIRECRELIKQAQ